MGERALHSTPRPPPGEAGMLNSLEFALRFNAWAESMKGGVTVDAIKSRWGVSRATAYRWFNAWRAFKEAA